MTLNLNYVQLKMSAGSDKQFPADPLPQIAFSGRSNVGKSSLINCLLSRKSLARVSSAPGKTITVNFYDIDKKLYFVDLPGYGYARRSRDNKTVWSGVTERYFTANPNSDRLKLVIQLVDSRVGPTDDDTLMIQFLINSGIPFLILLTKTDKLKKTELAEILRFMNEEYLADCPVSVIPFSAVTGVGKQEVWDAIRAACN